MANLDEKVDPVKATRCTVLRDDGQQCTAEVPDDAPFEICMDHMRDAYLYVKGALMQVMDDMAKNRAPLPERLVAEPVVYYVAVRDWIKIGTTRNLKQRMADLIVDELVDELLVTEPGGFELEQMRHKQFAHLKALRREYFNPGQDLLDHIEMLRRHYA